MVRNLSTLLLDGFCWIHVKKIGSSFWRISKQLVTARYSEHRVAVVVVVVVHVPFTNLNRVII